MSASKAKDTTKTLAEQADRHVLYQYSVQAPEAEVEFRHALELAPDHVATMNDLAVLLMEEGRNDEARALLERVLEIRPEDEVAAANLQSLG